MNNATPVADDARLLHLIVRRICAEGTGINSYELVAPDAAQLPAFQAGAHIDVHLGGGLVRQYSLSNDPCERHRYVIAVLHDPGGRGGSSAVHERLCVRGEVMVSRPRNHFRLRDGAGRVVLVAGGIGVTPLKSMAHALAASGREYELHYCARARSHVAFAEELDALGGPNRIHFHYDGGDPAQSLDIAALLAARRGADTQVYYCGPGGFMRACAAATAAWPEGSVHSEHFQPPASSPPRLAAANDNNAGFTAIVQSTGQAIEVREHESLVDALGAAGVRIETSCSSGLCGTCKTRYLSGEVEHNDYILSATEQTEYLTACVSRGRIGTHLMLDL